MVSVNELETLNFTVSVTPSPQTLLVHVLVSHLGLSYRITAKRTTPLGSGRMDDPPTHARTLARTHRGSVSRVSSPRESHVDQALMLDGLSTLLEH